MRSLSYLTLFVSACLLTTAQQAYAQYKTEQVSISTDDEWGYVEVCKDCSFIKAEPGKEYAYIAKNEIKTQAGGYEGDLLHGRAFLFSKETNAPTLEAEYYLGQYHNTFKQWLSTGEPVTNTEYKYGVKHGKSFTYVFGVLEAEEVFNKGILESFTSFTTEGEANIKTEFIDQHGLEKKVKITYYTNFSLVEAEGIQLGDKKEQKTILYNGEFKRFDKNRKLLVKGNYLQNLKHGQWTHIIGDVVNVRTYDQDRLVSEEFLKDGKPFTGTATELYSNNQPKQQISVKNGVREGRTLEYVIEKQPVVTNYKKGKPSDKSHFDSFIKDKVVVGESLLKHQCDGRGNGLYIDKIQHTKDQTIVYMHIMNIDVKPETGYVFTPSPGKERSFTLLNNETKDKIKVKRVFQLHDDEFSNALVYGEMLNFVLVFDRIPESVKNITLIEGEESYSVNEKGEAFFHWGCYDVAFKK